MIGKCRIDQLKEIRDQNNNFHVLMITFKSIFGFSLFLCFMFPDFVSIVMCVLLSSPARTSINEVLWYYFLVYVWEQIIFIGRAIRQIFYFIWIWLCCLFKQQKQKVCIKCFIASCRSFRFALEKRIQTLE